MTDNELKGFECMDCSVNTLIIGEYYMVTNELWAKYVPEHLGMICLGCLETRMGRQLVSADFPPEIPINAAEGFFRPSSDRMYERIAGHPRA